MDESVNGVNIAPSATTSFVNYDSHIRNSTLICNFIEYENILKESDGLGNANSSMVALPEETTANEIDSEPNNNNLRIRMMKQVLNNEDAALYHFTDKNTAEEELSLNSADLERFSVAELEEYRTFLKNTNASLKQEYEHVDSEFSKVYILNDKLLDLIAEKALKETSLKEMLLDKLVEKLDEENESDLSELLLRLKGEVQGSRVVRS